MAKQVAIWCLAAAVTVPAAADDHVPASLRMREPRPARPRWNAIPLGRRVAQVPPDGAPGDAPDDPAPQPPADPQSPPSTDPVPAPPAAPPPAAPAEPTPPLPPAAPPAPEDGKTEVIPVTGTTVERQLFTGRAPVSVITRDDLVASGRATLGDILQSMPGQSNAANAQVNAGGDGATRLNLRGLGAPRTLVLLNGRRVVAGGQGADAAVDINAIPVSVIERVEILKDGASALYGADAVGGVVNLVTRAHFDGAEASLLTSTSLHGDGTEYAGDLVVGFVTGATYFVFGGGYQRHDSVFASDREFSTFQRSYDFASGTDARNLSLAAPSGRLDVRSLSANVQPPGCSSIVCKRVAGGGWADFAEPGDLYNEASASYVYTPSRRYSVFFSAGNQLTESTAVVLEALYMDRNSDRQLSPVAFSADSPISQFSIYNPLGADVGDYRRRMTEIGPRRYVDNVGMLRLIIGLAGGLFGPLKDWKYEVSENYGVTSASLGTTGQLMRDRVADAIGPSMRVDDKPICVRTPGDANSQIFYKSPGGGIPTACIPLDLLAPAGMIPPDQLANLTFSDVGQGSDTQRSFLVAASGPITKLPNHGDISLSLGADYRSETGERFPPKIASVTNTTDNSGESTKGEFGVFEGYGELSIVPISGHPIAHWLEIDLGARVLRHSRFGRSLTYKAGALFRTVHGIAVRGTYATAFRAPSLFDLFGGRTERTPTAEDPCDAKPPSVGDGTRTLDDMVQAQCTAQGVPVGAQLATSQQLAVIGGNLELGAETARTTTVGLVVEPPQVKGLAVSVDYWRFGIDDAIETLGLQTIFANCYDRGIQAYCDQIHRDPGSSRIRSVDQFLQNIPHTTTSGIDVALWYDAWFGELGRLHTGFEAQRLLSYDLDTASGVVHGAGFYDLGVHPRYRANLSSSWNHTSGASAGFTLRFVGTYKECAGNNCNSDHNLAVASRDVDRYFKLDLLGGYQIRSSAGRTTLQVGVNNLFDATPPVVYNAAAANSDATSYDFVGRMAYFRLSQAF